MLSKYEILIERQIYRALHDLERLQDVWEVTTVVSSWVLDIEVSEMREQLGTWNSAI